MLASLFVVAAHPKVNLTQRNDGGNTACVSVVFHPGSMCFRYNSTCQFGALHFLN
jgi:hypothetical protein